MYAAPLTKKVNPVMEWNTAKIVYSDGKFDQSKWSSEDYPYWNTYKKSSIALQDHGAAVWYRNIRIRNL